MALDGSKEVAWVGQAFPYLIHHPNSFLKTENYGTARQQQPSDGHGAKGASKQHHGSDATAPAGTGTWHGPAPRGYVRDGVNTAAPVGAAAAAATRQPQTVLLSSGQHMPLMGLGTAQIKEPSVVKEALELGYRHLDCAAMYGNQQVVGQGLQPFLAAGRRAELYITSKLAQSDFRPERVRPAADKILKELNCQYLDLLLMHWPEAQVPEAAGTDDFWNHLTIDTSITIMDTWREMEKLVDAGLVKAIGVSNFSLKQVEELLGSCRIKPAVNQVELHPLLPQRKLVGVCFRKGVQCVAFSPLGGAGAQHANTLLTHPVVQQVAQQAGKSPAQVLLRWNMQRGVPVIPKATGDHLRQNFADAFDWALTPAQKAQLDGLESGFRFISPAWKQWDDPEEGGAAKPSLVLAK